MKIPIKSEEKEMSLEEKWKGLRLSWEIEKQHATVWKTNCLELEELVIRLTCCLDLFKCCCNKNQNLMLVNWEMVSL